jgi:tetratricopeptide (TPR) repeat protein
MATVVEALTLGLEHQRAGRLPEAAYIYRAVLSSHPENADALHLLGVIACHTGKTEEGAALVRQAIRIRPNVAQFHNTLGNALAVLGRPDDARFAFEWALRLDPDFAAAHVNLGNLLQDLGRPDEAVAHYHQALAHAGASPEIHNNLGNALRSLGRLDEAMAAFRQALSLEPRYPEAHVNLAAALLAAGAHDEAEVCCQEALRSNPGFPAAYSNLAAVLLAEGRLDKAEAASREALRLQPGYPEAYHNLADALRRQGRSEEAIPYYREAVRLKPELADAYLGLGNVLLATGQPSEALEIYQELVRRKPGLPAAHYNLGLVLSRLDRAEEAAACYRQALHLDPDFEEAHTNLGQLLFAQNRFQEAEACYRQALRCRPDALRHRNLAAALARQARFVEAEACCRQAFQPEDPETHRTLGNIYYAQRRLEETAACYEAALRLDPEDAGTRWNRSMLLLLRGEFDEGWREYEWRWQRPDAPVRKIPQPLWDGTPLAGRRILVYAEQGMGDTIQFVRYLPMVEQAGGRVIFQCHPPLVAMLEKRAGLGQVIGLNVPAPDCDVQAPLLSLPRIFHTTLDSIPAKVPYLAAEPARVEAWRTRLASLKGYRVGVAWTGSPRNSNNYERSLDPRQLTPLLRIPGIHWISLQKEHGETDLPLHRLEGWEDVADTAAIMMNLDLVISVDTMVAHLAGALGRPVWTLLAVAADFRWLLDRLDSPWYSTMRLFRQGHPGEWEDVIRTVEEALRHAVRG